MQFHVVDIFSTEELINNTDTKKELQDFVDISKIALLFSTTSNVISNILFTWALFCIYFKHCTIVCSSANIACFKSLKSLQEHLWKLKVYFCGIREEKDDKTKPLDPFNDVYEDEDVDPFSIVVVYKHKKEEIIITGLPGGGPPPGGPPPGGPPPGGPPPGGPPPGGPPPGGPPPGGPPPGGPPPGGPPPGGPPPGGPPPGGPPPGGPPPGGPSPGGPPPGGPPPEGPPPGGPPPGGPSPGGPPPGGPPPGGPPPGGPPPGGPPPGGPPPGGPPPGCPSPGGPPPGGPLPGGSPPGGPPPGGPPPGGPPPGGPPPGDLPLPRHDFFSKQDERTSTPLQGERLCRCVSCFLFSFFCLLVVTYAVFFHYLYEYRVDSSDDPFAKKWEAIALASYSFSLLRTLVSCFIFSKLMYAIQKRCEELELFVLRVNENYLNVCQSGSDVFKYANYCWLEELKEALEQIKEAFEKIEKELPELKIDENVDEYKQISGTNETYKRTKNARIKVRNVEEDIKKWKGVPKTGKIMKHIEDYDEINEVMKKIKDEIRKNPDSITGDKTKQSIIVINANSVQGAAYIAKEVTNEILHAPGDSTSRSTISRSRSTPTFRSTTFVPDGPQEKKEIALKYLKERDKHFVKISVSTLGWFQLWFLFHWVLYMLSTFMILSLLIDAIALHVKAKISHIDPGVLFDPAEIGFLFMYSLAQCFFLLYPCLRAASVTRTRARVIRHLNEQAHTFTNIPADVMNEFIDSMRKRKFSFRLRILCAQIPFNLNIAYFSIAFGFVGVVVTLITSVKT